MTDAVLDRDPDRLADAIVEAHAGEARWLDEFADALDRRRAGGDLARVLQVWGLSQVEAARLFGVSRQAVSKWIARGLPADRVRTVADLSAATDVLTRYLKRDRVPAVVRREAAALGGLSLLDLAAEGRSRDVLEACRAMFEFSDAQA